MRARLIRELSIPAQVDVSRSPGGFKAVDSDRRTVTLLDHDLNRTAEIPMPSGMGRLASSVSPDGTTVAFANLDDTLVTGSDGSLRWHHRQPLPRRGLPQWPAVHLDASGLLWLYVPYGDDLAVFDAADGRELSRVRLASSIGAGEFLAHPDGEQIGLSVAQGQDGTDSVWARFDGQTIVLRHLPGEQLADVVTSGEFYLDLPHNDGTIAIRSCTNDAIIAVCDEQIPGFDWDNAEWLYLTAGALITDDRLLIAVDDGEAETETHVVLSTRSLQPLGTILYDTAIPPTSVVSAGNGRWLTTDRPHGRLRLWSLEADVLGTSR
jgi:hypothetical protein